MSSNSTFKLLIVYRRKKEVVHSPDMVNVETQVLGVVLGQIYNHLQLFWISALLLYNNNIIV